MFANVARKFWDESMQEAMHQAEFEFGVQSNEWVSATSCTPVAGLMAGVISRFALIVRDQFQTALNELLAEAVLKANVTKRVLLATRYVLEKREGYYG